MFYINIQSLGYDGYSVGQPTQIGPFDSKHAAEAFMEESSHFHREVIFGDYSEWKCDGNFGHHSVSVRDFADYLVDPARWT